MAERPTLTNDEIEVLEEDFETIFDLKTGCSHRGKYRILSDGRRQWRPVDKDGKYARYTYWREST